MNSLPLKTSRAINEKTLEACIHHCWIWCLRTVMADQIPQYFSWTLADRSFKVNLLEFMLRSNEPNALTFTGYSISTKFLRCLIKTIFPFSYRFHELDEVMICLQNVTRLHTYFQSSYSRHSLRYHCKTKTSGRGLKRLQSSQKLIKKKSQALL